ncbi:uncharacterized protein [Rutidosis leptorrhynchoides]|uniref:uncharacterized protein n=1 Tax=Rutidosis leptorrhynchoides TaxID=125765 RepID=UPI003A999C10
MKILSVNVRGFGVAGKFSWVKGLCLSEKPDITVFQETKCMNVNDFWVHQLWGHNDVGYAQKDAIGNSGGGDFFLAIRGTWVGFGHDKIVVNIYGPHCDSDKKKMWETLDNLMMGVDSGWVLCGDFNEVRSHEDRLNCVFHEARARKFNEFIVRNNLIEVPINGRKFTRISDDGTKFSKLDRFLVSNNFINLWNDLSINVLDKMESDHCPLVLHDGVDKVIIEGWNKDVRGYKKDCVFRDKLKNVKAELKDWSKKEFGNLDEENNSLKEIAQRWELKAENGTRSTLNNYRPISLIGSFYKIIAKLLSNRIRKVIPSLVGFEQSAFIKGRNILDGALIANESISYLKHERAKSLIFKVDFEKPFDCLNWDFLMEIMQIMGFGAKWRGWIRSCLESASISVLVNGSPTREFKIERGVRQGDPLSPFLFIIAAEGLNVLTKKVVYNKRFMGVEIGSEKIPISHLQYADDTIFFGEWSVTNLQNLFKLLKCFEHTSGLKVNYHKSNLFSIGVEKNEVKNMSSMFGCNSGTIPFIYLSLQVGGRMNKLESWNPVIDKFTKRLSNWKARSVWYGGRLTLVKSVLNSLPLFKRLYHLERDREATVGSRITLHGSDASVNGSWNREPMGRAKDELMQLQQMVRAANFNTDGVDSWHWEISNEGIFKTSVLSKLIDEKILHTNNSNASGTMRNMLVPKKVEVFVWRVLKGRILVLIELDKRGVGLHSVRCPICDNDIESINHSLLSYDKVRDVWDKIFGWWNISRPPNCNLASLLGIYTGQFSSDMGRKIWQAVVWTSVYLMWKNRNEKVFKNMVWNVPMAVCEIQVKSFEWIAKRCKEKYMHITKNVKETYGDLEKDKDEIVDEEETKHREVETGKEEEQKWMVFPSAPLVA